MNNFLHRKRLETVNWDLLTMLRENRFQFLLEESRWDKNSESFEIRWRALGKFSNTRPIYCSNGYFREEMEVSQKEKGVTLNELTELQLGPKFDWTF